MRVRLGCTIRLVKKLTHEYIISLVFESRNQIVKAVKKLQAAETCVKGIWTKKKNVNEAMSCNTL